MDECENKQLNHYLKLVAKGKNEGLDGIYEAVSGRMLSVALGYLKNRERAEDAVSDSFVKIVRFAESFDGKNGYGWIIKIVSNTCLNILRQNTRQDTEPLDTCFDLKEQSDCIGATETHLLIKEAMARLPDIERYAVYCKYFLDLTVRETAEKMRVSKSAAQRAVSEGERKLKELLNESENDDT